MEISVIIFIFLSLGVTSVLAIYYMQFNAVQR